MNEITRISADGDWTLYYAPENGGNPDDFEASMFNWPSIKARVPGNVELDLMRAGITPDPFYDQNYYLYAKYEYYQWIYTRTITIPMEWDGKAVQIRFLGVDTIADIYIDDSHAGRLENMLIEHVVDITGLVCPGKEHRLTVHIHSAMNFARSKYYPVQMRGTGHRNEICHLRKAPHCFGWDIMPRLVSAGIWRGVYIETVAPTRLLETYYATPLLENGGIHMQYAYRFTSDSDTLDDFYVRVYGRCGTSSFEHIGKAHFVSGNVELWIESPKLWWPKGYGEQWLYDVTMELIHGGDIVDSRTERVGLRTLRLERRFERGNQEFKFFVNEKPIFVKGTNWVPLDALHSRDAERLPRAMELARESGVNMIRCWGGNVYESEALYDACDEEGILVWQDFSMGNTNYPQTDDFVPVLEHEIGFVVRNIRNHACVAVWSSDNEVDLKNTGFMYPHYDSRKNRVAHDTLRRILQANDPYRFYLCSSPEIPEGYTMDDVPEQHTWGARAWYKDDFYKHSSARFIGEAGYHGCPAPSSIAKVIPPEYLWPMDNLSWAAHSTEDIRITAEPGGRNRLMRDQVKLIFGDIPGDLETFALLSQISQAEAMKFFVERTRRLKWDRTGIIWWNLIDGWPQISDAVVDYYYKKKIAFHYLKRSQRPLLVFFDEMENWTQRLCVGNDTLSNIHVSYRVWDADTGETIADGKCVAAANETTVIENIRVIGTRQRLLLIEWKALGGTFGNHYITGFPPYDSGRMLSWLELIRALPEAFELEM